MLLLKLLTYSTPLTTVPDAPDGVIVTKVTPASPGLIPIGVNAASGFVDSDHRSPVGEVTAGSKAFVVAVIVRLAVPAGAGDA